MSDSTRFHSGGLCQQEEIDPLWALLIANARVGDLCHRVGFDPKSGAFNPERGLDSTEIWGALQKLSKAAQQQSEAALQRVRLKAAMESLCNKLMGKIAQSGLFMNLNKKADVPFRRETLALADDKVGTPISDLSDPIVVLRLSDPIGGLYQKGEVLGFRGDIQSLCAVIKEKNARYGSGIAQGSKQDENALGAREEIEGLFVSSGLFMAAASAVTELGQPRLKASLDGVRLTTLPVRHGEALQMDVGFERAQGWFQKTFRGALDGRGLSAVCTLGPAREGDLEPTSRMIAQAAKAMHEARIDYMIAGKHTKKAWHPAMLFSLNAH